MASTTADGAVHDAASPSASGTASGDGDLASVMLARLTSEPDVLLAAQQLGITAHHLTLRPLAAFQDKASEPEVVEMRFNHHLSRRLALAEELQQHYDALRAEAARKAAAAPPVTPAKNGEPAAAAASDSEPAAPVLNGWMYIQIMNLVH